MRVLESVSVGRTAFVLMVVLAVGCVADSTSLGWTLKNDAEITVSQDGGMPHEKSRNKIDLILINEDRIDVCEYAKTQIESHLHIEISTAWKNQLLPDPGWLAIRHEDLSGPSYVKLDISNNNTSNFLLRNFELIGQEQLAMSTSIVVYDIPEEVAAVDVYRNRSTFAGFSLWSRGFGLEVCQNSELCDLQIESAIESLTSKYPEFEDMNYTGKRSSVTYVTRPISIAPFKFSVRVYFHTRGLRFHDAFVWHEIAEVIGDRGKRIAACYLYQHID